MTDFCSLPPLDLRAYWPNMDHPTEPADADVDIQQGYLDLTSGELKVKTHEGLTTIGAGPKGNYTATTTPAATDDSADGYSSGSVWVNVTTDLAYICVDASVGAAIWLKTTSAADLASLIAGNTGFGQLNVGTFVAETLLTVTSNTIAITGTRHRISNGGNVVIDTITGGAEGDVLFLRNAAGGTTTFNNTASILTLNQQPVILRSTRDNILFVYLNAQWRQINAQTFDYVNIGSAAASRFEGLTIPQSHINSTAYGTRTPRLEHLPNMATRAWFGVRASAALMQPMGMAAPTPTGTASEAIDAETSYVNYLSGAAVGNAAGITSTFNLFMVDTAPEQVIVVKTGPNLADIQNCRIWCGMFSAAPTNVDNLAGATKGLAFWFSTVAGHTTWWGAIDDGTTMTTVNTTVAVSQDTKFVLRLYVSSSTAYFRVNNGAEVSLAVPVGVFGTKMGFSDYLFTNALAGKNFKISRHINEIN